MWQRDPEPIRWPAQALEDATMTSTDHSRPELTRVGGVPETALSEALLATLPPNDSEAPWTVNCSAVLWTVRPTRQASESLPSAVRGRRGVVVVGGIVRYLETPVGPYDEVFGLVMSGYGRQTVGTVTFMAVDSPESLVGGRANWAMPKTLAAFAGGIGSGRTIVARGQDSMGWRVSATPRVIGPRVPVRSSAITRQEFPGGVLGDSQLQASGKARPATVKVEVESDGPLAGWLRPGRHLGALAEGITFTLGVPQLH
jgi:hypothetical protein